MPETRQAAEDDVVRARRIEVVDSSDRVRLSIGDLEGPGTHEITGFGIQLFGPNGSACADLIEDAGGARLCFMSSGNEALHLGAEDANTLMLDRGSDDLVYLPAGSPGNEVSDAGPFIIFSDAKGAPAFDWRVDLDGRIEPVLPDTYEAAITPADEEPDDATPAGHDCLACRLAEENLVQAKGLLMVLGHEHPTT